MSDSDLFSRRKGFAPPQSPIVVREEAPPDLRRAVLSFALDLSLKPKEVHQLVFDLLAIPIEHSVLMEFDDAVIHSANYQLAKAPWFEVYDLAECIYRALFSSDRSKAWRYEAKLNAYFEKNGIGWKLENGRVEARGSEAFEHAAKSATAALEEGGLKTAAAEIHEALNDLSRRPKPDITGAIQHSMAALECIARECAGDQKATLGQILRRSRIALPPPLPTALEKIWGYSSEVGRHVREGHTPSHEEAELVVGLASVIVGYLASTRRSEVPPSP